VIADVVSLAAIPQFRDKAAELGARLGIAIDVVAGGSSADATLAALPAATQAVYVTPLWRLEKDELLRLANGLAARKLPSMSLLGRSEVEAGLLLSIGGMPADDTRFARRVGLNIQRILLGDEPGRIEVGFRLGRRLLINMRTARAIGFLPRWAVLIDAEKLYDDESQQGAALSFVAAMFEAADANLARQAAEYDVLVAGEDVRSARSAILPQLDVSTTGVRIDADRANPLFQPEQSVDAQIGGRQLLYSERAWSAVDIARRLEAAAGQGYAAVILDTFQASATAYLSLLRAEALEAVRASNLEVTRTNLELARVRESIGASGRADVLRWESTIARDRQQLLAAQAVKFQARTELNRVLNREQHTPLETVRDGLGETLAVLEDERFSRFIGNPLVWETFIDFSVTEALELAPEIRQVEQTLLAQERDVLAARRAWYVPDIALSVNAGRNLSRSGAGSNLTGLSIDDDSWTIALNASLPLFTSGALRARLDSSRYTLSQVERRAAQVAQLVEARMRVALHQVGGSYPAIELSNDAASAAQANLELVIDAYSKGAVSVTVLVEAQDAALAARLAAAEAEYAFLIDYMEVLRARGSFDLLLEPQRVGTWYASIENFFNARGVSPLTR
jgi:outer membrane protein TolC